MTKEYLNDKSIAKIISICPLFSGLDRKETETALDFFDASIKKYKKGDFIQSVLSAFDRFGLVISGNIQVLCDDIDGYPMIMANVSEGDTFGESLCFLSADSPVYIRAVTDATVMTLSTRRLKSENTPDSLKYGMRFTEMLARRTLAMNDRIQILSKITLREKVLTLLNQYKHKFASGEFSLPFDRADMAIYLGTDRAALSRELSKLKSEGVIDYHKNDFIIKK